MFNTMHVHVLYFFFYLEILAVPKNVKTVIFYALKPNNININGKNL